MSALPQKADIVQQDGNVRFVSKGDIAAHLFIAIHDHLSE